MTVTRRRLLETVLSLSDETNDPVTVPQLARRVETDPETVREHLDMFRSYELVKRVPDQPGYEPTVTARELCDLDIDEGALVVVERPDEET